MESLDENLTLKIEQFGGLFTKSLECLLNLVFVPLSSKDADKKEERLLMSVTQDFSEKTSLRGKEHWINVLNIYMMNLHDY